MGNYPVTVEMIYTHGMPGHEGIAMLAYLEALAGAKMGAFASSAAWQLRDRWAPSLEAAR
jgi:hypothetical protein